MNCFSITSQIEFHPRQAKDYEPQWNKSGSLILFLKVGMLKKDDGIVSKEGIKTSAWPCNGFVLTQNHEKWCKFCLAWLGNPFRFWVGSYHPWWQSRDGYKTSHLDPHHHISLFPIAITNGQYHGYHKQLIFFIPYKSSPKRFLT